MGGYTSALSMDVSSIYHNPALASLDGKLQIEFFGVDSSFGLPDTWGVFARKPKDSETTGAGIFYYRYTQFLDTTYLRSNQFAFAFSDDKWGLFLGVTGKLLWEKYDYQSKFRTGFTMDLGLLVPIHKLRIGLSAKNLVGMKSFSEPKRYEGGVSFHHKFFTLTCGSSSLSNSLRTFRSEISTNWGYGGEFRFLEHGVIRAGRGKSFGRVTESIGTGYATKDEGILISYSLRRFRDDPNQWSHWISYTTSAISEHLPIYK